MSFPSLVRLLPGLLAPLLACSVAHAQIHEEKPGPGLEREFLLELKGDVRKPLDAPPAPTMSEAPLTNGKAIGRGDFSVVCYFDWMARQHAVTGDEWAVECDDGKSGWKLVLHFDGSLSFTARSAAGGDLKAIQSASHAMSSADGNCVVLSAHRDARQPGCGLSINGVEAVSGMLPPVDLGGGTTPVRFWRSSSHQRRVDRLVIYNRALTRPEILELTLRGSGTASDKPKPKHPAPPPGGPRFIPQADETIALIGGTEAVALAESGELEALLLMAFPQTKFHFRCLAWEGDTVFRQDRPMNFGSLEQQLRRVNAGAVFVMFGRQECLDAAQAPRSGGMIPPTETPPRSGKPEASGQGASRAGNDGGIKPPLLDEFKAAFEKLLATVEKVTPNIVVIGPPGFEKKDAPLPSFDSQNIAFASYLAALEEAAKQRGFTFVNANKGFQTMIEYLNRNRDNADWLNSWKISGETPEPTSDGVTLTKSGAWRMGECIASEELGVPRADTRGSLALPYGIRGVVLPIQSKNRLWHDYWRPSNWAFLHGDRTNQPSSRDPVNPQVRLFPAEQEKYLPLIKEAEDKIYQLVQEAQKKIP